MAESIIQDKILSLYDTSPYTPITDRSRIVIFSDLHMGNGGGADDFKGNSALFTEVVRRHYAESGFSLVLNGDVEELYRFSLRSILKQWDPVYSLFSELYRKNRLIKLVGNHDYELLSIPQPSYPYEILRAVKYRYGENSILLIHGHQASSLFERWNTAIAFGLRYFATPLKIKNRTVAYSSRKKFKTEQEVYKFSSSQKVLTCIGHTHRPLFESHSKIDELKFKIENRLRSYEGSDPVRQAAIAEEVREFRRELSKLNVKDEAGSLQSMLYNDLLVPSLFNSGCVIGKRGITGLEISGGRMSLVHWFDSNISNSHLKQEGDDPARLDGTDFYKTVLKSESLSYIFARINLLA